ncbi:MAG: RhuM family protein [Elusimicrobiota bacterium]
MDKKNEVVIYKSREGKAALEVKLENDTIWLTQKQIAELFDTSQQNISLHINNIFREEELDKTSVHKENLYTAKDGRKYLASYYNLDMILSTGYRISSKRATQFRIWATSVLKNHLVNGFSINNDRLQELQSSFESQRETYMHLRFFLNKFLGTVARKDVVDVLINKVDGLVENIAEIRKLVSKLERRK